MAQQNRLFQVSVGALVIVCGSAAVFDVDPFQQTFDTLRPRQCLPADFNLTPGDTLVADCEQAATAAQQPPECAGAPAIASFYNCLTREQDFLSADATFFNLTAVVISNTADSEDPVWDSSIIQILTECSQNADAALSTRQFAAYTYICLRWSLFSVCDRQQERRSSLDAEGTLRRVRFLSGSGPLSPNSLRDLLQRITGRTLEGCATRHFASNSVFQQYENEIARIVCLIQKFVGPDGRIDLQRLKSDIPYGAPGAEQLQFVLNSCIRTQTAVGPGPGRVGNPTAEEFVNCWADWGVLSCIFQQANEVASQYPTACDVTLN